MSEEETPQTPTPSPESESVPQDPETQPVETEATPAPVDPTVSDVPAPEPELPETPSQATETPQSTQVPPEVTQSLAPETQTPETPSEATETQTPSESPAPETPSEAPPSPQPQPQPPRPMESDQEETGLYWISRARMRMEGASEILEMPQDEWTDQELHLFIVTDAGKPVYSRYGTVQRLSPILCTCVAILGHMESLNEQLDHFRAGSHTFVFLPMKPFVFIAVSKSSLPVSYLLNQLIFLYSLFLSLFSRPLIDQLSRRPSCDFRQLAEGTRPAWDGVINNMSEDPAFVFAPAIPVAHMKPALRQSITKLFEELPKCKLSMLLHRNRVLAVGTSTRDAMSMRIIVELMWTPGFQNGETWTPFFPCVCPDICHHIYIKKSGAYCLIALYPEAENHAACPAAARTIFGELERCMDKLKQPMEKAPSVFYCWAVQSIPLGQVYITDPDETVFDDPNPKVAAQKMQELCRQLAKSCDMVETNGVDGEYMFRGEKEVVVALKNKDMKLYAVANSADLPDSEISGKLQELKNYIQKNYNEIFLPDNKFHVESLKDMLEKR